MSPRDRKGTPLEPGDPGPWRRPWSSRTSWIVLGGAIAVVVAGIVAAVLLGFPLF